MPYDFSSGFSTSQTEIIVFISFFALLGIAMIVSLLRRPKQPKRKADQPLQFRLPPKQDQVTLTSRQEEVLKRVTWYAKKKEEKERVRHDEKLFARCAKLAVRFGVVSEMDVQDLGQTLGHATAAARGVVTGTKALPVGARVSLASSTGTVGTAVLTHNEDESVELKMETRGARFYPGETVEAVAIGSPGVVTFKAPVVDQKRKRLRLQHSYSVKHSQRRKHRRQRLSIPVRLEMYGLELPPMEAKTVDISAGGVATENPKKRFAVGSIIQCHFNDGEDTPLSLRGTVIRTSKRDKVIHVRFSPVKSELEHRLFRFLFGLSQGKFR